MGVDRTLALNQDSQRSAQVDYYGFSSCFIVTQFTINSITVPAAVHGL
jgi:hypothetical protein